MILRLKHDAVVALQLSSPCSSGQCSSPSQRFQNIKKNPGPLRSSPPAYLIKTPVWVNPLAFRICGICSSSTEEELEYIYRRNYSELIKEWVTHLAKTT
jgi:hypothetical protein